MIYCPSSSKKKNSNKLGHLTRSLKMHENNFSSSLAMKKFIMSFYAILLLWKGREKTFCLAILLAQGLHYVISLAIVRKIWTRTAPVIVISGHQIRQEIPYEL